MVIFIICMALVVIAIIAMIITIVYSRTRGKQERAERERIEEEGRRAELENMQQKRTEKGEEGEDFVAALLDRLDAYPKYVFRDIVIDTQKKLGTTEVDFLVVVPNGVFVLDVKSWDGAFSCEKHQTGRNKYVYDLYWRAPGKNGYIRCDDEMQAINLNTAHYKHVKEYLNRLSGLGHISDHTRTYMMRNIHSLVVFRNDNYRGNNERAVNACDLINAIKSYPEKLYDHTVCNIGNAIKDHPSETTREEHIENLKNMYGDGMNNAA